MRVTAVLALVVRRDLLLAVRQQADVYNTLLFFVVVVSLVPLGVGPEPALLRPIAPGVLWVAALLAAMLSLQRLFAADHADGTLEQWLLTREPLPLLVLGKIAAHWLTTGAPLTLIAASSGADVRIPRARRRAHADPRAAAGHAGAVADRCHRRGADAGTARRRRVASLLVLPLYVPVLIFGAGAAESVAAGLPRRSICCSWVRSLWRPWCSRHGCRLALRISVE